MTDKQREHALWLLENGELSERHRWWILKQLEQEVSEE